MYKNKIPYQPRTVDPSTLVPENLLTLANIITSGIDHYSPSLGAFTSVFGTFQPTISKAVNT